MCKVMCDKLKDTSKLSIYTKYASCKLSLAMIINNILITKFRHNIWKILAQQEQNKMDRESKTTWYRVGTFLRSVYSD